LEKFEIDVKWASYFVIVNVIVSIVVALFAVVFFSLSFEERYNTKFVSSVLIMFFVIQLFYFVRKAIKENKKNQTIRIFSKVSIFFRVLGFYIFIVSLKYISPHITSLELNSILQYRKNNLSEFLIEEDEIKNNKSNWLNDVVIVINRRFSR
jgi:membrane protease YdiL (CAAX protease family)